jgi:hypothetical protein
MLVLTEALKELERDHRSADNVGLTRAALAAGCTVRHWPVDLHLDPGLDPREAVEAAELGQIPPGPAIWIGSVPRFELYAGVYGVLSASGHHLLNPPEAHRRAMELQLAYPRLHGLTPESEVVTRLEEVPAAVARLGLPVFIKGSVFSRKELGWRACVAETETEAEALVRKLLAMPTTARHHAILRRLVPLKRLPARGERFFPGAREYRVFLYAGEPFAWGFYWDDAPEESLAPSEEQALLALAREAARRMEVPFLTVDLGQLESGDWLVIETGDPQFAGLSRVSPRAFWAGLLPRVVPQT